jgi:integrase
VSGFDTKRAAERELRVALSKMDAGSDAFPESLTARDLVVRWLEHLRTQGEVRERTVRAYEQLWRDFATPTLGMLEVRRVSPAHVQRCLDDMTKAGKSARTVAHARAAASACFAYAVAMQLVDANPVRATKGAAKRPAELRIPTAAEVRTLIEAAPREWRLPVLLAGTTGCRRSELLGATWGSVDLDAGWLSIASTLQRVAGRFVRQPPKTARSARTVPLVPETVAALRQHRTAQAQRLLSLGIRQDDETPVLDRGDGTPLDPDTYTHAVARIAKTAGLPGVRLHDLRHAFATTVAASGAGLAVTQRLMGHSSAAFTASVYTHPDQEALARATDAVARALG